MRFEKVTDSERIDDLENEVRALRELIYDLEYATAQMVTEKIEEATIGLVSLEEVEAAFDM